MTDPSPEGVGCVAPAALEKVLTAAVGNHVLVQRGVPVTVVRHAATAPLVEEENIFLKNNDQVSTNLGCLPLPGWCSMHPSGQRYCLWCTAPTLLLGPDVHFHSPAHVKRWIMGYVSSVTHKSRLLTIKQINLNILI